MSFLHPSVGRNVLDDISHVGYRWGCRRCGCFDIRPDRVATPSYAGAVQWADPVEAWLGFGNQVVDRVVGGVAGRRLPRTSR